MTSGVWAFLLNKLIESDWITGELEYLELKE